jgi:transposase InsO family protein
LVQELADDDVDVAVACRVLNVSRSGYYEWKDRPLSTREQDNELLLKHIKQIHAESRLTYGSPRVHAELTMGLGLPVNLKRVARLMRQAGIQGLHQRRRRGCTVRDPHAQPAADLVNRVFTVDGPNRLWVTDITEHPTDEGSCTAPRSWTLTAGRSSAGPWPSIFAPNWCSTHSVWRSFVAHPTLAKQYCTLTTARNTRHGRSANDFRKPGCSAQWAA